MLNFQSKVSLFNTSRSVAQVLGTGALTMVLAGVGNTAQAATLNWYELWDSDATEYTREFANVDGSGVDVTVTYSDNMWDGHLNLYDNANPQLSERNDTQPLDTYHGTLRFTNDRVNQENTSVQIDFSEAVDINEAWLGSLSVIGGGRQEWIEVSAYSETGDLVVASNMGNYKDFFGTTVGSDPKADDPDFVEIFDDSSGTYTLKGLGQQKVENEFGRVFFGYEGITSLVFEHYATNPSNGQGATSPTSVAIGEILFESSIATVPEPTTTLGLFGIAAFGFGVLGKKKAKN